MGGSCLGGHANDLDFFECGDEAIQRMILPETCALAFAAFLARLAALLSQLCPSHAG